MKKRRLGNSDLQFTTIGLGTWAMGGDGWPFAWGPQDDRASIHAIHKAVDLGINWIDTAPVYGFGHAEEVVGKAIVGLRDRLIIATKCGRLWEKGGDALIKCIKANSIKREVEASLQRLNIDRIDLYQMHWPEPDEDIEEGWQAMSELLDEGKIRYIGVSNYNVEQLKRIQPIHPVTSLQPPYSMLRRDIEPHTLPYCREHNIGVVAYSPMQAGLLTGKFTRERVESLPDSDWRKQKNPYYQEPQLSTNLKIIEKLRNLADQRGITLSQFALAWVLRRPEVTAAIVGARKPQQIEETAKAGAIELDANAIEEIEGILRETPSYQV